MAEGDLYQNEMNAGKGEVGGVGGGRLRDVWPVPGNTLGLN